MKNKEIQSNCISKANTEINKKIKTSYKHNKLKFGNKAISFNYLFYMILILIFLNISKMILLKESFITLKSNEINIKIKGFGVQNILYHNYANCPNQIYLNGEQVIAIDCHIINIPFQ